MKVDTDHYSGPWTDSLSIRIQLPLPSHISDDTDYNTGDEGTVVNRHTPPIARLQLPRASVMALQSLPMDAPLVLFTPFLVPAGSSHVASSRRQQGDPFEVFGQRLARHHPNICHVPYVSSVGITDTHLAFITRSEAVVTVICEPNHPMKKESMREQHNFATAALKAFRSRPVTLSGDGEFVLVQCAADDAYKQVKYGDAAIVETDVYDEETAVYLADAIFGLEE